MLRQVKKLLKICLILFAVLSLAGCPKEPKEPEATLFWFELFIDEFGEINLDQSVAKGISDMFPNDPSKQKTYAAPTFLKEKPLCMLPDDYAEKLKYVEQIKKWTKDHCQCK